MREGREVELSQTLNFLEFPLLMGISSCLRGLMELYVPSALEEAKNAALSHRLWMKGARKICLYDFTALGFVHQFVKQPKPLA